MEEGLPPSLPISGPAACSVSSASVRKLDLSKSISASATTLGFVDGLNALFIFLAASGEAAQAQLRAVAQGTLVSDAMITKFEALGTSATVNDAADALIRTTQTEFPIVDGTGRLRARAHARCHDQGAEGARA